jgi:hypothetical protein
LLATSALAQDDKLMVVHKFELWGDMRDNGEKLLFLAGFTNGLFKGPRSQEFHSLGDCMGGVISQQIIAMIDKYYQNNPEQWSAPIGIGIVSAITVKGGPCEGKTLP